MASTAFLYMLEVKKLHSSKLLWLTQAPASLRVYMRWYSSVVLRAQDESLNVAPKASSSFCYKRDRKHTNHKA